MGKWAAVIGSPIAHSLSPALHRAAFSQLDLHWDYRRLEVTQRDLPAFLAGLDADCVGLSVTAPLKRDLLSQVPTADGMARLTGSANTLARSTAVEAVFNTDVHGIVETVRPALAAITRHRTNLPILGQPIAPLLAGRRAPVVLGTGATACSALAAVRSLGAHAVYLVGRSFAGRDNALAVGTQMGLEMQPVLWRRCDSYLGELNGAPLIISTVPATVTECLADSWSPNTDAVLLDVTYAQGPKPLTEKFEAAGAHVCSPLEMLVHQGIAQVKIWTSRDVDYPTVFAAVQDAARHRGPRSE